MRSRRQIFSSMARNVALLALAGCAQASYAQIVISQIYGGGGNEGATLRYDFIELFNRGSATVNITGWTVQHASATGSSWERTVLAGSLQPGQYFLIEEQEGKSGSLPLPVPDATGGIAISAVADKIALVNNSGTLNGIAPTGSQIVDFVGYGAANAAESQPAGELNNTTALLRNGGGCADTQNNASDFSVGSPNSRNSRSLFNPCSLITPPVTAPQFSLAAVTNAASFASRPVSPGEMITVFGSNLGPSAPTTLQLTSDGQHVLDTLGGTRVLFDGIAAPMIYTSSGQLSAVVPFALVGRSATHLQVEYNGKLSAQVLLPVAPNAPGIFPANGSGQGQAAALNQDYSLNSFLKPASRGSYITVYLTGAGQTNPLSEDGAIASFDVLDWLTQPVTAQIAGTAADAVYFGSAPGLVTGVIQINIRVPAQSTIGDAVPITVTIGGVPSQGGVTVAIADP